MGLDLKLLPIEHIQIEQIMLSIVTHTVLNTERSSELYRAIEELKTIVPLDCEISCYVATLSNGESGYGDCKEDPYGDKLTYVPAKDLLEINSELIQGINKAVWAYLSALPENTNIVLYWS